MKNLFKAILAIGTAIFFVSCADHTPKKSTKTKKVTSKNSSPTRPKGLIDFNQSFIQSLDLNEKDIDSISMYVNNRFEFVRKDPEKSKKTVDGKVTYTNKEKTKQRIAPAYSKLTFKSVQWNDEYTGLADYITYTILFQDELFEVYFKRNSNGSFSLYKEADVMYNNEEYTVTVPGGGDCRLMFYFNEDFIPSVDIKIAGEQGTAPAATMDGKMPPLKKKS